MGYFKTRYTQFRSERSADIVAKAIRRSKARAASRVEREKQDISFARERETMRGKRRIKRLDEPLFKRISKAIPARPRGRGSVADHLGSFGSAFNGHPKTRPGEGVFSSAYGSGGGGSPFSSASPFSNDSPFSTPKARAAPKKVGRVRRARRRK